MVSRLVIDCVLFKDGQLPLIATDLDVIDILQIDDDCHQRLQQWLTSSK